MRKGERTVKNAHRKAPDASRRARKGLTAILLALLLLLAGCAGQRAEPYETAAGSETAQESEAKPGSETAPESETAEGIFLPEEESAFSFETTRFTVEGVIEYLSMARDGDGYRLIAYTAKGKVDLTLDKDFRTVSDNAWDEKVLGVVDSGGDGSTRFTVEAREEEEDSPIEEGYGIERIEQEESMLCREGEALFPVGVITDGDSGFSLAFRNRTVYVIGGNRAYIMADGELIERPRAEGGCEMMFRGFLRLKGTLFAVLNETDFFLVDRWYLAEITGKRIGELPATNLAGWLFTEEADGETCDFVRGDGLYRTDGEKIEKLMDFEKAGVSVVGVRGFWREEGRFVLLLKDGILVLSDKTA